MCPWAWPWRCASSPGRCSPTAARAREAASRKPAKPGLSVLLVVGVWLALLALVAWLVLRPLLRQE